jgi:hypothetical protein
MLLKDAIISFRERATAGEITDRRTAVKKALGPGYCDVTISHVRKAVQFAAQIGRAEVDDVELGPFVKILGDKAYAAAQAEGLVRPGNYRNSVELFLDNVFVRGQSPRQYAGGARYPIEMRVHELWRSLHDALEADAQKRRPEEDDAAYERRLGRLSYSLSRLVRLQELAALHGVLDPHELPDYDTVRDWSVAAGERPNTLEWRLNALRNAIRLLGDATMSGCYQTARTSDRGLRSLPNLAALLRERGCSDDPRNMELVKIVSVLAPKFGAALHKRLEVGGKLLRSTAWQREQVDAASRAIASMVRLGIDPAQRTFLSLWAETVASQSMPPTESNDLLAEELGEAVAPASITLISVIVEEQRPLAFATSPRSLIAPSETPYVETIHRDLLYLWGTTETVYSGMLLKEEASKKYNAAHKVYKDVRKHIENTNTGIATRGHIDKGLIVGLGQIWCQGVPWLRRRAVRALTRLDNYWAKHGDVRSRTRAELERAADRELSRYITFAVIVDDGLRVKNYSGAQMGKHVIPEVIRDKKGRPVGFASVQTHFSGFDEPWVCLKRRRAKAAKKSGAGAENVRKRFLSPAIVDLELLFRYCYETRPRHLVRRGLLPSVDAFDPDSDNFAFITGPKVPGARKYRAYDTSVLVNMGAIRPDSVTNRFKRTMYDIMTDALRMKLPAWNSPKMKAQYRGVLGPHSARSALATYLGGVRQMWGEAQRRTNDSFAMLLKHYDTVEATIVEAGKKVGPTNPNYFDKAMDRILAPEAFTLNWVAFWSEFDPEDPAAALPALEKPKVQAARLPRNPHKQKRHAA